MANSKAWRKIYISVSCVLMHRASNRECFFFQHINAISCSFTSSNTTGGNTHENWALLRLLPCLIGNIVPEGEPAWQVITDLKDIAELVVAPVHNDETIAYLEGRIFDHRQRYLELFPHVKLLPKHHYLEHYPQMIHCFGSLILSVDDEV